MNYKTYAEAKIANPDSEIVTTGKNWGGTGFLIGTFEIKSEEHYLGDSSWVICNPADYCSSIKEFFDAGFVLNVGDSFIGRSGRAFAVKLPSQFRKLENDNGYILSAAALNGGCKIPAKAEQWTIYNNTLPLCDLTDEQAAMLFNAWRGGLKVWLLADNGSWCGAVPDWCLEIAYRIKHKSERELFIDKSLELMTSETERTMEQMFGVQFDAGARYKDPTQHFGENI